MRNRNTYVWLFLSILFVQSLCAQEAQIWKRYTGEITDSNIPVLPNYSYAGYKLGLEAIPNNHTGTVFNVTDYGAIANDNNSDQAAIQAAIDAAEANNGGVIMFPPGEFLVNTTTSNQTSITVNGSNIILKGSGSTTGGTIINMKNYMRYSGGSPWGTPSMIRFNGSGGSGQSSNIAANAKRGDIAVKVQNASIFVDKKYCRLVLNKSKAATSQFTDGKPLRSQWERINAGVEAKQFHEIASVNTSTNMVTFKSAIMDDVNTSFPWRLETYTLAENCGFEDIHFKANFTDDFDHHSSYIHDYAWDAIDMSRLANSWVRRVRFTNVTMGVKMVGSYSSSLLQIYADGNSGHNLTAVEFSSNVLQGLMQDNTSKGIWHGCDMSGQAAGCVVWRIGGTKSRGFDLHAAQPRTNLIDLYESNRITGNGGNFKNLPNHLTGLTIWNQKRTGGTESNDFWDFCSGNYCGLTVANPIIVGYHGSATTLSDVKYEESKGTKVSPESLYEAQLEHRLGTKPAWIDAAIQEYDALINMWTGNNTANIPPTVSFSNLPTGNTYQEGISLLPIADAQDADGSIAKVALYLNNVLVREEITAPYEWGHLADMDVELKNMPPGNYTLKATATDNEGASTDAVFTFAIIEQGVVTLLPLHDAYIQGTVGINNTDLRVENGNRITYLMFDLSGLPEGAIERADLKLTVGTDDGEGSIRIYEGNHNNWLETSLDTSIAPASGSEVANSAGLLTIGSTYSYDVKNANYSGQYVTFVVKLDAGGNDVSFASKENNDTPKPQLIVKVSEDVLGTPEVSFSEYKVTAFPNPTPDVVNLTRKSDWILYAINGVKLDSGTGSKINIETYSEGLYIIKLRNNYLKIRKSR